MNLLSRTSQHLNMLLRLCFLSFVVATTAAEASRRRGNTDGGHVVKVKDGRVVGTGEFVGSYTSSLNTNVISKMYQPVSAADWQSFSMINSTRLRYLELDGEYQADVPLQLPSLFVLQLTPTAILTPAANLSLQNTTTFTALVEMKDVHFSAVLGGTIDASALNATAFDYPYRRGYQAVAIKGGSNNAIRGVRVCFCASMHIHTLLALSPTFSSSTLHVLGILLLLALADTVISTPSTTPENTWAVPSRCSAALIDEMCTLLTPP